MYDYHLHSAPWSADGQSSPLEMVKAAICAGITEMCFTEHVDEDFPSASTFDFDFAQNAVAFRQLFEETKDLPITIHRGIEIGSQPHLYEISRKRLEAPDADFEFIIGSTHLVNGADPYYSAYFEGKTQKQAFEEYLMEVWEMVRDFGPYHVVGHIGYPTKGCPQSDNVLRYAQFGDILDMILQKIIDTEHGIEVNTSGFRYSTEPLPEFGILERYKELGGEILTLGSDAHNTGEVGRYFPQTIERLKQIGFQYVTVFRHGKPVFVKLS